MAPPQPLIRNTILTCALQASLADQHCVFGFRVLIAVCPTIDPVYRPWLVLDCPRLLHILTFGVFFDYPYLLVTLTFWLIS